MSKSLDGYYQETGRAGRDGKDSDCVLFYRGQDMARMMGLVFKDTEGIGKREYSSWGISVPMKHETRVARVRLHLLMRQYAKW